MDVQLSLLSPDSPTFDTHRYVGALLEREGNVPIFKRKTQQCVPMACSGLLTRRGGSWGFRKARGEDWTVDGGSAGWKTRRVSSLRRE